MDLITKSGFLLIADISVFTDFIKSHNMRNQPVIWQRVATYWQSIAGLYLSKVYIR